MAGFWSRYLSPSERLGEVLFGLIMVLAIVGSLRGSVVGGEVGVGVLVAAALGANIAWGIVDGVLYVVTSVFERGRHAKLATSVREAGDAEGLSLVRAELESSMLDLLGEGERDRIIAQVREGVKGAAPKRERVEWGDLAGAFLAFCLVFATAVPIILPFIAIPDCGIAFMVANAVAVALLFAVGFVWAGHTHRSRLQGGVLMAVIGALVVVVTVLLGG